MSPEIPVVRLSGELDITRAPSLRDQLMASVDNRHTGMVVDLTGASYIDSAGVNVLFELAEELRQHQLGLAVVIPSDSLVERVVTLVDLSSVASVQHDVDAALAHIRGGG